MNQKFVVKETGSLQLEKSVGPWLVASCLKSIKYRTPFVISSVRVFYNHPIIPTNIVLQSAQRVHSPLLTQTAQYWARTIVQ